MFPRNLATAGLRWWRGNTALVFLLAAASTQAQSSPGTALSFDGLNGVVEIGAAPLPVPWTAEFWVNRQNALDDSAILLGGTNTMLKLEQWQYTRRVGFTQLGVADYLFNYTAPTGTWVHLAFVGSTDTKLYVNGALQDVNLATISLPLGQIGGDMAGRYNNHLRGTLDEVRVWNLARSQAQIQANMNRSLSVPQTNLMAYWRFNEGSGLLAHDSTGRSSNTGYLSNGVTWVSSTMPFVPDVTNLPASSVMSNYATLNARVNPNSLPTTAWFRWGPTTNYGKTTPHLFLPSGINPVAISSTITGLPMGMSVHFLLLATNAAGQTLGGDLGFRAGGGGVTNHVTVTNNSDSGSASLRFIVNSANPGDIINFATNITNILLNSPLVISSDVTLQGPGAAALTISGNGTGPLIIVTSNANITASGITFENGFSTNGGVASIPAFGIFTSNVFKANTAAGKGGAFYVPDTGFLWLINCTLWGNHAANGGAIDVLGGAELDTCTVTANSASSTGGGLRLEGSSYVTLSSCTVAGNSAFSGGGLEVDDSGSLYPQNTIVAGNTIGAFGSGPDIGDTPGNPIQSNGYNLIGRADGLNGWQPSDLLGSLAHPLNPLLARLQDYGGPTPTMALLPGSPAIDTGYSGFPSDQRYLPRQQNILNLPFPPGDTSDIGAFEVQPGDLTTRPELFITRSGNNVELRWDIKALAFTLDSTLSLTPPSSWAPVSGLPTPLPVDPANNQLFVIRITTPNAAVFYRLRAP
jgi:parallel beta-helix repeat protein